MTKPRRKEEPEMMCPSDLYRIAHQEQEDRMQAAQRNQQLSEARATEPSLRERLRHVVGSLMAILA
jgi:hypothetical protein